MILVRDIFQIAPENMKDAKELSKQAISIEKRLTNVESRVLTDLVGDFYTLVFETEFRGMGHFEEALQEVFADKEWQASYPRFRKLIRGGRREIFTVVE